VFRDVGQPTRRRTPPAPPPQVPIAEPPGEFCRGVERRVPMRGPRFYLFILLPLNKPQESAV